MPRDDVPSPTGDRLALLRQLGFGELTHDSHVPFLSHLLGVRRLLVEWGERPALCDAGLFHSAYGTEYFQPTEPASRDDVRRLIGDDAEEVAWMWCTIRRDTIELGDEVTVIDRQSGRRIAMSDAMTADIATLWCADTVEQIARMAVEERGFAHSLGAVLPLASPMARASAEALMPLVDER